MGITAMLVLSTDLGSGPAQVLLGPVSIGLAVMSLLAWCFVIAAVVTDRRQDPPAETADEPAANDVVEDDPLAYDPADFEPPRRTT